MDHKRSGRGVQIGHPCRFEKALIFLRFVSQHLKKVRWIPP